MQHFDSLESRQLFSFGAPLANFGINGQVTAPIIGGSDSGFGHAETLSNGKIVAGVGGGLTRYTTAGVVDTTFGTNGIVGFKGFSFRDFAIDASGRIDVLASGASGTFILRYTAAGVLDTSFASGGTALVESSKTFHPSAIDVQTDGKIIVAGSRSDANTGSQTARVYRLTAAGAVDTSFGSSGIATIALGSGNLIAPDLGDNVVDVRALSNGKIEILGSSYNYAPESTDDDGNYTPPVDGSSVLAVARLTGSGAADSTFGSSGVVRRAAFDNETLFANAGVIRADGSAVVTVNDDSQAAFVGFSSSGAVAYRTYDPSFYGVSDATDATALGDGRVGFVSKSGSVWTIDAAGAVSNVVTPQSSTEAADAIVATANDDLVTTVFNNGGLTATAIDAGKVGDPRPDNFPAALAVGTAEDGDGNLSVAFYDAATKTLKYTYRTPAGLWGRMVTVDSTVGAGANLSIAASDVNGKPIVAIAYYDAATADLRVAVSSNFKKFSITTVAVKGTVGLDPSLQITDAGGYAVSYYSKTTQSLYYSLYANGKWSTELVDSGGSGAWNELMFDPYSRRPAIAYSGPKNTIKYALKSKTGWGNTIAATTASGAGFVNLAFDGNLPVISYYDLATANLDELTYDRYAASGQRWTDTTVASRGVVGSYNDLYVGYNITLYAWNRSDDSVSQYTIGSSTTSSVVVAGGGRYLSTTGNPNDTGNPAAAIAYLDTATGDIFVR